MKRSVVVLLVVQLLMVCCTQGMFAQHTHGDNDVPDSLVKACYATDTVQYFTCLDELYARYNSLYTLGAVLNAKGKFLLQNGMYDRCIVIAGQGLSNAEKQDNEINKGVFHNLLGACYQMKGDMRTAIRNYINAATILERAGDTLRSAIIKNNVANIYYDLKDYQSAELYIKQAYQQLAKAKDTARMSHVLCVMASIQLMAEDTANAMANAKLALALSEKVHNTISRLTALSTIASVYHSKKYYDSSFYYYQAADSLSGDAKLSYFSVIAKVGLVNIYNERKEYAKAAQIAREALRIAKTNDVGKDLGKIYRPYATSLYHTGNYKQAYDYLNYAYEVNDSVLSNENKEVVNDITIKYETAKKDKQIAQNNLKIATQAAQLYERNMFLIALLLIVLLLLLVFVIVRMKNKNKLQQLAEQKRIQVLKAHIEGEEKERVRLAKELHDGIANDLAVIKLQLDELPFAEMNEATSGRLKDIAKTTADAHVELRRVSHSLHPVRILTQGLAGGVKNYLEALSLPGTTIHAQVIEKAEISLPAEQQLIVFRLVQELIGNAIKHSSATEISLDLIISSATINLVVEDNGGGIPADIANNPSCLLAVKENTALLNGTVDIDSTAGEGTTIVISIPNEK